MWEVITPKEAWPRRRHCRMRIVGIAVRAMGVRTGRACGIRTMLISSGRWGWREPVSGSREDLGIWMWCPESYYWRVEFASASSCPGADSPSGVDSDGVHLFICPSGGAVPAIRLGQASTRCWWRSVSMETGMVVRNLHSEQFEVKYEARDTFCFERSSKKPLRRAE
jgi:hypothetical protein